MSESIKQRLSALGDTGDAAEIKKVLDTILADITAIRTSITGITAKLDADAGVTDADYASLHDPAALTTTS